MKAIDKAIRAATYDKSGVHYITYKDVDGNTTKQKVVGTAQEVNRRKKELEDHDCKILKVEMFANWR